MKKPPQLAVKKVKSLKLAKQARGTLETVVSMIEGDTYCPEIIQQADSVIGLLKSVKRELLAGHFDTCVMHKMRQDKPGAIRELLKIYNLSN